MSSQKKLGRVSSHSLAFDFRRSRSNRRLSMTLLKKSGDGSPGFASSAAAGIIGSAPTSSGASSAGCGSPLVPGKRTHTSACPFVGSCTGFSFLALGSFLGSPCCCGSIVLLLQHRFNYVSRGSLVCIERQMASSGCYLCYCRFLAVLSSCSLALFSSNTMSTSNGWTLCFSSVLAS